MYAVGKRVDGWMGGEGDVIVENVGSIRREGVGEGKAEC